MPTTLVIDDNKAVQTAIDVLFSLHDIDVLGADTPEEGLACIQQHNIDLVIQDMNFARDTTSGEEGIELFEQIRRVDPDLPVILLTAWTHLEQAVELVKAGAADYLAKPWDDTKLVTTARNLLELREATQRERHHQQRRQKARDELASKFDLCGLIYRSDAMLELLSVATRVAPADVPVLITGANGAGKEKVAEIVQANSSCKDGPFVKVNAGALPAELIEAELFGTASGAYTGAETRAGRFEAADGGTLFLDEIGNLPLPGQAKLLRVLQTGEFERLGSTDTRRVAVRVISATNTDLNAAVSAGTFREDLLYRLNVIELQVAPLQQRGDDILLLAEHFLTDGKSLSESAEKALIRHSWPGNVRELRNVISRAGLLAAGDTVNADDLNLPAAQATTTSDDSLDERALRAALERTDGVVAKAARDLGLSRQALYRRMEKFGIDR